MHYYCCSGIQFFSVFQLVNALLACISNLHLCLTSMSLLPPSQLMIFNNVVYIYINYSYFHPMVITNSHSRYNICVVYIKMLKIHSERTSPAEERAISSPQHLERCSFPNTSMTPNCLFIIEITGDFSRIKWQMIKFSLWLRAGRQYTTMAPLTLHCPLLATPAPCRLITSSRGETSGIQNKPLT